MCLLGGYEPWLVMLQFPKAQAIKRMPGERQIATLLAFARVYESVARDDAVDLLHLLQQLVGALSILEKRERLGTLDALD